MTNVLVVVLAGLLAAFGLAAAGILWWARRTVAMSTAPDPREQLIGLAARAAADEGGKSLLELLHALEGVGPGSPVTVHWLRHVPAKGPAGVLIKITWDGNEWRRVWAPDELQRRLAPHADFATGRAKTFMDEVSGFAAEPA